MLRGRAGEHPDESGVSPDVAVAYRDAVGRFRDGFAERHATTGVFAGATVVPRRAVGEHPNDAILCPQGG